jgi:PAS domain S-box-containing protein
VRWAWLPIPVLAMAMIGLWAADLRDSFDPPWLLFTLNFLFATVASGVIVYLVCRSFLARGTPGLLLLNCGVVFWGLAGITSAAVGGTNYNASLTTHNVCAWFSALCHLTGVVMSSRTHRALSGKGWWLLAGFLGVGGIVALVATISVAGWTPAFFVQGEGGTLVRHLVLGSASLMFALSAIVLRASNKGSPSSFFLWYGFGLYCLALAMLGLMVQSVHGSPLGWTARGTQWIGGIYLLLAAFAVARESNAREISLSLVPGDVRLRYVLAVVFVAAAVVIRLVFLHGLGNRAMAITLYPAVLLATLYGGRWPGLLAALLATFALDFLWLQPFQLLALGEPGDWLILVTFLGTSALIVWVADAMQRAQARASAAEGELKLAAERQRVEEDLRELNLALMNATPGISVLDPRGRYTRVNEAYARMMGYEPAGIVGMDWQMTVHPEDCQSAIAAYERMLKEGSSEFEVRAVRKDGSVFHKQVWMVKRVDNAGNFIGHHCFMKDITERKLTEQQLRASEERLRLATQTGKVGIWEWDIAANRVSWSDSLFGIHGIDKEQFEATVEGFAALVHPDDRELVAKSIDSSLTEGAPYEIKFRSIKPNGEIIWIFTDARVLRLHGKPVSMIGATMDITELTRAENALRHAHQQLADRAVHLEALVEERTAKLKEMVNELEHVSYAISHDMRAPLRAMNAYGTFLLEWASGGGGSSEEARDYSKRILTAASRLDQLIQDALHYTQAALHEMPLQPVDVAKLIHGLVYSYPNLHPDRGEIRIEGELPVVCGNEALLTQCFSNLLGNAVKFVGSGTRPCVRVYAERNENAARIWIADNGIGIPENAQQRLFGMFQKLNNEYEGTGIGLAIVRKVAERMGGNVGVESQPGNGSRFWVELPLAQPVQFPEQVDALGHSHYS